MTISLNPGFVLLLAALAALALPARFRQGAMLCAALAAAWVCFSPPFGAGGDVFQLGLRLSTVQLDATSQLYGFAAALVAALASLAAFARRNRFEDVALMLCAGGAASAVFAGDLVTFAGASGLGALGAAGLTIAGGAPEARNAGLRLLGWHALAALAITTGAGLAFAHSGEVRLSATDVASPAGAFLFAGLLIQCGAPLAHVWLRDGMAHGSPLGAAAIGALMPLGAFVGLARLFPGETALLPIGVALALLPLPFAFADADWRRSAAYGLLSLNGLVLAALGLATPMALAGAAACAFAHATAGFGLLVALGAARDLVGVDVAVGRGAAVAARAPMLAALGFAAAASIAGAPGTGGYVAHSLLLEAFRRADLAALWVLLVAAAAAALGHGGFKAPFAAFFGPRPVLSEGETPFALLLSLGMAAFFIIATGVAPHWLYALGPADLIFHRPYAAEALLAQAQALAATAAAFALLVAASDAPSRRPAELLDTDWLWRRPGRRAAQAVGRALSDLSQAGERARAGLAAGLSGLARSARGRLDRPSLIAELSAGIGVALAIFGLVLSKLL